MTGDGHREGIPVLFLAEQEAVYVNRTLKSRIKAEATNRTRFSLFQARQKPLETDDLPLSGFLKYPTTRPYAVRKCLKGKDQRKGDLPKRRSQTAIEAMKTRY